MSESLACCPGCGGDFRCGASDRSTPCVCKTIALDAHALTALRERYTGCLCLACLRDIQRGELRAEVPST
jgi:hypothetical protein